MVTKRMAIILALLFLLIGSGVGLALRDDKCQKLGYDKMVRDTHRTITPGGFKVNVHSDTCSYTSRNKDVTTMYLIPYEQAADRIGTIKAGEL